MNETNIPIISPTRDEYPVVESDEKLDNDFQLNTKMLNYTNSTYNFSFEYSDSFNIATFKFDQMDDFLIELNYKGLSLNIRHEPYECEVYPNKTDPEANYSVRTVSLNGHLFQREEWIEKYDNAQYLRGIISELNSKGLPVAKINGKNYCIDYNIADIHFSHKEEIIKNIDGIIESIR